MKKILNLLIGTNNPGKYKEICDLLPKKIKKYSPQDFKILTPEETGKSFEENSILIAISQSGESADVIEAVNIAKKSGAKTPSASELLKKKTTKAVSPGYKQQKASGYNRTERQKLQRTGDRIIKDIRKGKNKPASDYEK